MKQLPILYSTPMVQAILEDRKGMTRRITKPQIDLTDEEYWKMFINAKGELHAVAHWKSNGLPVSPGKSIKCPYGKPGDIHWVRENFRVNSWMPEDGEVNFRFEADGAISKWVGFDDDETFNRYWIQSCDDLIKAGYQVNEQERFEGYKYDALRLRPNIFLRKEAARIWLQVIDVRVERLQEINEEDAKAEGVQSRSHRCGGFGYYEAGGDILDCICQSWERNPDVMGFKDIWCRINGNESWDANPFCWVISFKVLSTTGKPDLQNLKAIA